MTTGAELVEAARSLIGVPWRHMGRNRQRLDCVGLVLIAARAAGLPLAEPAPYARGYRGTAMVDEIAKQAARLQLGEARDGDLVVFSDAIYSCHVGYRSTLRGLPAVIHARADRGKVVEDWLGVDGAPLPRAAFRFHGMRVES